MKLLTIDIGSYIHGDILLTLDRMGISYHNLFFHFPRNEYQPKYYNDAFEQLLRAELQNPYDAVFTTNFYPIAACICHELGVKYLAWSYDSPMNLPNTDEMEHPTNYIFLFDRREVEKYENLGMDTFYHLPLAVNCARLDQFAASNIYATDVSFMGQLYESSLPALTSIMTQEQKHLINTIVQTQLKIYGNWFVEDLLTDALIDEINAHYRALSPAAIQINRAQLAYSIAQQITHIERIALLRLIHASGYQVDLYTYDLSEQEKILLRGGIRVHSPISYGDEMPRLFKSSRINLNPTLKNIASGISLRALDIIGCGGFLLTNYQPEIAEYFTDGKEVILYHSMEDAVDKTDFYLSHDDERLRIARNGYLRAQSDFRYEDRIADMLKKASI